jgi:hypothetical protein
VVSCQLDDADGRLVHWIPAHTAAADIGKKVCSDGCIVSEDLWCANQMVDLLAKDAAALVRRSHHERSFLLDREKQLRELAVFMGLLTYAANHFVRPDGVTIRDSTAVRPFRKRRQKRSSCMRVAPVLDGVAANAAPKAKGRPLRSRFVFYGLARPSSMESRVKATQVARLRLLGDERELRKEASFQEWWQESRSQSMKPRDIALPTAHERMSALRQRVTAKSAVVQG